MPNFYFIYEGGSVLATPDNYVKEHDPILAYTDSLDRAVELFDMFEDCLIDFSSEFYLSWCEDAFWCIFDPRFQ